jgi:hypothetical protein
MEEDMAVDVALWLILAVAVAFIGCGCIYTVRTKRPEQSAPAHPTYKLDRAA